MDDEKVPFHDQKSYYGNGTNSFRAKTEKELKNYCCPTPYDRKTDLIIKCFQRHWYSSSVIDSIYENHFPKALILLQTIE